MGKEQRLMSLKEVAANYSNTCLNYFLAVWKRFQFCVKVWLLWIFNIDLAKTMH